MSEAFLTIVTRSFKRPKGLARCVQSVARQSDPDVQQIIVHDALGRGVEWSHVNLCNVPIGGQFVFVLDDDDYLIDDQFVESLKALVAAEQPDVVFVQMDVEGRILPRDDMPNGPQLGEIAMSCFVVRRDVWLEHVVDFLPVYEGDLTFIHAVWHCPKQHRRATLRRLVSKTGGVGGGHAESGDPVSYSLSPA